MSQLPSTSDVWNEPALVWIDHHAWRPETAYADIALLDGIDASRLEDPLRLGMAIYDAQERLVKNMLERPGVFEAFHAPESFTEPDTLLFFADRLRRFALSANRETSFTYETDWLTRLGAKDSLGEVYSHLFLRCCNEMHPDVERQQWLVRSLNELEDLCADDIYGTIVINPACDIFEERSVKDSRQQAVIGLWLAQVCSRGDVTSKDIAYIFSRAWPTAISPFKITPGWLIESYCPDALNDWALIEAVDLGLQDAIDIVWDGDVPPESAPLPALG